MDSTQRLDASNTVTSRSFYDGYGRLVETRTAAPGGNDIVQYVDYDPSGRVVNASVPYFVTAYTGGPGSAAFSKPDATQAGTQTTYDGLGRTLTVEDPLSETTSANYQTECGWTSPADTACYQADVVYDALMHQSFTLVDGLGRVVFSERETSGGGDTWDWYSETHYTYDASGHLTKIFVPYDDPATTTFSYDATGRTIGMTDPDRGTESYSYDANGNVIQTTDARGASGKIYAGYDGLNRQVWRNTSNSPTGAYVTYSYDSTTGGNYGVGRLTGETFSGALGSGSYSYVYDRRGETTASTLTLGGTSYPVATSYNDAGQALMLTYPTGETVTAGYSAVGWLGSLTRTLSGTSTTLLGAISYTGSGGATGQMTSAQVGNATYSYSASFDTLARPTDVKTSRVSDGATLFEEAPTYDALGNITRETTTLPTGTDVQQFCYDDFSRLTWAGSTGTPPCTGTAITPGTLAGAAYTQSFSYDNQDRLRSGPLGSYSYDDPNHLHAATFVDIGSGSDDYSATYDASGNMLTRAPSESQPQQKLTYDNEGRLTAWQNAPSSPTSTAQYLYDGEGNRVEQQTTTGGSTTTTVYAGNLESVTTTGSTTTTTTYYYAAGQRIALAVNGTLSYLASDLLGSATVALNGSGTPTASQLYAPYGGTRYSNGTMPTDYGFTGQRADSATGLDYYGTRYYDPSLGQFSSADTVIDGPNRYGYVGGNPISYTDPSGNERVEKDDLFLIGASVALATALILTAPTAQAPGVTGGLSGGFYIQIAGGYEFIPDSDIPYGWDGTPLFHAHNPPKNTPSNPPPPPPPPPGPGNGGSAQQASTGEDTATPEPEAQPSTSGRGARRCTPEEMKLYPEACGVFEWLYGLRGDLGMAPDAGALVYLEIGDIATYGYNAHGLHEQVRQTLGPNSATAKHAEGLAFYRAYLQGVRSGTGTLYVDRSLCGWCGKSGGVRTMVRSLGLSRLMVYELLEEGGIRISEILP